ncbi:MAG: RNA methyltransferase [Chloroflexota bacterium]
MTISSKANGTVKMVRALRHRKHREESGLFFIEGIRIVTEAANTGASVEACVVAPDLLDSVHALDTVERLRGGGVPYLEVTSDVFRSVALKDNPQGIGAVVRQRWASLHDARPGSELCWIVLDSLQDPGNLGTILRTSDAVGAAGVILIGASTDPYDPSAVRASMGAVFSQWLIRTDLHHLAHWKATHRFRVVGTSDGASLDYRQGRYDAPLLLLMGSEREGLTEEEKRLCDEIVRIPMVGHGDSLNVAVATGVMLYEIFRQRG